MDDETHNLIAQLCTRVGMIMEDHSSLALTTSSMEAIERTQTLAELGQAIQQMERLISAAIALNG